MLATFLDDTFLWFLVNLTELPNPLLNSSQMYARAGLWNGTESTWHINSLDNVCSIISTDSLDHGFAAHLFEDIASKLHWDNAVSFSRSRGVQM